MILSIGDILVFRNVNIKVSEILVFCKKATITGEVVNVPGEKKIDIHTEIEISDDIIDFSKWENRFRLSSVKAEIYKPEISTSRFLTLNFEK